MKKLIKNFLLFFVIFIVMGLIFSSFAEEKKDDQRITTSELITEVNNGNIEEAIVQENKVTIKLKEGEEKILQKENGQSFTELLDNLSVDKEKSSQIKIDVKDRSGFESWMMIIIPILLPFMLIAGFIYFMMRGVQGSNNKAMMFGQSQAKEFKKDEKKKTTFKDVAGSEEAKNELKEVVEFLKYPKKFHDLGARIPKGFLLLGPPGTGKTLMAKAVAGEADVPFFSISGSEFVEMFVGVGASRVRDLFKKAKKSSPCIIFIDEIDAVGRRRGAGLGGSHDEREQTLNQILVEMDGFDDKLNVIVIAATNRPDVLDPALLRPGRFDRQVVVDSPDLKERESILKVHAKKKPLAKDVSLKKIAERTPGFSGADLANLLNEAAIAAARKERKEIDIRTIFDSIEKVMIGPERKSRVITEREKKITAYHEAGHALVAHALPNTDPVQKISIIARGRAGGYTLKTPTEDKNMHPRSEFVEELAVLLGGHTAEKLIFGEVTTGATSDLRRATSLSRSLITEYGMSEKLAPRTFGKSEDMVFLGKEIHEQRDYSEKTAELIDEEIEAFINNAVIQANKIMKDRKDDLEKIVKALLEKETIERHEFEALVGKKESK